MCSGWWQWTFCHCITVLSFHLKLSFEFQGRSNRIQKSVLKKSSKTDKNTLLKNLRRDFFLSSLNFLETQIYSWNLKTFRFFKMSSCSGHREKPLKLFSFELVRRNKNEKVISVLMVHIPKASCSLYRRCFKIAVTKIKKKNLTKQICLEVHDLKKGLDPYVPPVSCRQVGCPKVGQGRFVCFYFGVSPWRQLRINSISNNC